jgi:phospholipid transport system substrate-binding protein
MRASILALSTGLYLAWAAGAVLAAVLPPDRAIRETTEQLRTMIRENRSIYESDAERYFRDVEATVVPRFDTRFIGQIILGPHWRKASEVQRERFIVAFKNNLVHSYARAMLEHADNVELAWKPVHMAAGEQDTTVGVDLIRKDRPPIPIGFSVHRVGQEWKIYDVTIDNISLATTFRGQFNPELKENGVDGLIARLESRQKPIEELPEAELPLSR